jgi:hypothetical protein
MNSEASPEKVDCLQCRITGTCAFMGVAGYALYVQHDEALKCADYQQWHRMSRPFSLRTTTVDRVKMMYRHGPKWLSFVAGVFGTLSIARALR